MGPHMVRSVILSRSHSWLLALFVFLVSRDFCMALPRDVMGLSAATHLLFLFVLLKNVDLYM